MGRLAGFKYPEVARKFRNLGFELVRQCDGSHEIWRHPETGRKATLVRHRGDVPEGTLRSALRQGGISINEFLQT